MHRAFFVLSLAALTLGGCSISHRRAGITNKEWRTGKPLRLKRGRSSMSDVMKRLGPPSHVIELEDSKRTIFYYLLEDEYTRGLTLVIFNYTHSLARYDRAMFIFNAAGKLEAYSISPNALEVEDAEE